MKKKLIGIFLLLMLLAGCSAKLSQEKATFSGKGISYSFQLPSTWEKDPDAQANYGASTLFAAKDKKSNSSMFITAVRKDTLDLADFGSKTREQLSKTYSYKNVNDVYMKEFKLNSYNAYKFTVFTKVKTKESWAHIYYIETKTGFVQLVYYSADDNDYEKRAKIIDESAKSLEETKVDDTYKETTDSNMAATDNESVIIKNAETNFDIKGFRKIKGEADETLLVIRYEMTNLATDAQPANRLKQLAKVTQKKQELTEVPLPASEKDTALGVLEQHKEDELAKDQSVETIAVYTLKEKTGEVILTFSKDQFPEQEPVILDLDLLK